MTTKAPRSGIRLPHWGWIAFATVVLVIGSLALSIWLPYHREQQIVEKIKGRCREIEMQKGGPKWLRRVASDEHMEMFSRVIGLVSNSSEFTDADLASVTGLTKLRSLVLWETSVTEAGLAHLEGLANLEILDLHNAPLDDKGISHLNGLAKLNTLTLSKTSVSDSGFETLQKALPKCLIHRW